MGDSISTSPSKPSRPSPGTSRPTRVMSLLLVVLILSFADPSNARRHSTHDRPATPSPVEQKYKKSSNASNKRMYGSKRSDCQKYGCSSKQCYKDLSCPTECHNASNTISSSINADGSESFTCLHDELLKKNNMTEPAPSFKEVISLSTQQLDDFELMPEVLSSPSTTLD